MENHQRSTLVRFIGSLANRKRLLFAVALCAGALLLFLRVANQGLSAPKQHGSRWPDSGNATTEFLQPNDVPRTSVNTKQISEMAASSPQLPLKAYSRGMTDSEAMALEPRVAYSAELSVVTREFAHSRSNLEDILDRHRGYVAKLRMVGQPTGSVLSATLRVPSSEYRSALAELKTVGLVEHEEEAADEVTQQHGELEARLVNAQNEEQRLLQLLQKRDDRTNDQVSLQRQVEFLRAEIERIQSERSAASARTSFANVFFSLKEERATPAETIGAKLRNAAVSGLSDALESISSILLFLASRGPLLALWAVLIYLPARFFWRRLSQWGFGEVEAKNS
jgi:hypothetical protein